MNPTIVSLGDEVSGTVGHALTMDDINQALDMLRNYNPTVERKALAFSFMYGAYFDGLRKYITPTPTAPAVAAGRAALTRLEERFEDYLPA